MVVLYSHFTVLLPVDPFLRLFRVRIVFLTKSPTTMPPTQGELEDPSKIDPREKILRHADKHDEFDTYMKAYNETQPKPIYAQDTDEENEDDD